MKNLSKNKRSEPNLKYLLHRDALKHILVGVLRILKKKKKFTHQPKTHQNTHSYRPLIV